jgi:hypothetical protein
MLILQNNHIFIINNSQGNANIAEHELHNENNRGPGCPHLHPQT